MPFNPVYNIVVIIISEIRDRISVQYVISVKVQNSESVVSV